MMIIQAPSGSRIQLKSDEKLLIDQLLSPEHKTRIGLSEALGVSPAWVTKTLKPLIARCIVEEYGKAEKSGGRRARLLGISREMGFLLGLDVGLNSFKIGLSDLNGRDFTLDKLSLGSDQNPEHRNQAIVEYIFSFLRNSEVRIEDVRGIGVCVSDAIDTSEVASTPLRSGFGWEETPFLQVLVEQFPKPLILADRDVSMMALGEQLFGNGQDSSDFIFLKIGNRISAGIVCQGQIYRGASGYAGDIGHMVVEEDGPSCHCGKRGCLVAVAGGRAIARQALELAKSGKSTLLSARLSEHGNELNAVDVGEVASQGDLAALELIDQSGQYIGKVLTNLVRFYNPKSVYVGGGVSKIGHRFLNSVRQVVLSEANPMATRDLRMEYSQLGESAGVMGAIKMTQRALFVESSD